MREITEEMILDAIEDGWAREDANEKDCMDKIVQDYEVQYDDVILYV